MAITWEWEAGAHFVADSPLYEFGSANVLNIFGSKTQAKTGAASFRHAGANTNHFARKAVSASRQKRTGLFVFLDDSYTSSTFIVLAVADATPTQLVQVHMVSDGSLALYVGGSSVDTYATTLPIDAWFHIGLDVKIDSSAGWAVVYLDGTEVMRYEGNTGNANLAWAYNGPGPNCPDELFFDDWYCEDTAGEAGPAAVPLRQYYEMALSGDGNYSQFTGSDGNQTSNYALVDENPPNGDTDYVYATAADVIDSYATTDYTIIAGMTVNAVHPFVIAKKTGTAATTVKPFLREDSTDWAGSAQACNSDYTLHIERRTTDPAGAAWDQDSINGLEVGVKSAGAYA